MIEYRYVVTPEPLIAYCVDLLRRHLQAGESVLWFVSGGSAIQSEVEIAKQLSSEDLSLLSVSLIDERYGDIGHSNENWQQLLDLGFAEALTGATLYRVLQGKSLTETAHDFNSWLDDSLQETTFKVAVLGIGPDGHTAGIKPETEAVSAHGWATEYIGDDFERITSTFDTIKLLDEAIIQAMGENKAVVLDQLLTDTIPLAAQPAQILKQVKKSILFTDYKEEIL